MAMFVVKAIQIQIHGQVMGLSIVWLGLQVRGGSQCPGVQTAG